MSSSNVDLFGRSPEGGEDLASNVAFETSDDLILSPSLSGTSAYIFLGSAVMAKPDHNYVIESCIGLAAPPRFSRCRLVLPEEALATAE